MLLLVTLFHEEGRSLGIPERKQRERQNLRQRVLDAAEQLFVTEGYQNVSMRKIAETIEYSPTTIYRLFRNKADIMNHLLARGYRGVYQRYEEILARRPASPLETLNLIITEYVTYALDNPNHYELWFRTGRIRLIDHQLRIRHGDWSHRVYQVWLERIDECKAEGLLPDRETLILFQLIWGIVHGMISLRIHHPRFPWLPIEQHVEELHSLIRRGLS
jgi:AcrR family transcriptional regulator